MDIGGVKRVEGKEVTIFLKNNIRYSNIIYKVCSNGTIEFTDNKTKEGRLIPIEKIEEIHYSNGT